MTLMGAPGSRSDGVQHRPKDSAAVRAGSYFVLSMFDRLWKKDMTEEEALHLMEQGVAEVKRRLVIAPPSFIVKVIDKDGIRTVKTI